MGWITPKTDWVGEDYFNKEDYNRIASNLIYIKNFAKKFVARVIYLKRMGQKTSYAQFLEPEEVNNFQHNLHSVNDKTAGYDLGEDTVYIKAGNTPTYEQWNRIEGYTLRLHDYMKSRTSATRLTQKLGNTDSRRGIRI